MKRLAIAAVTCVLAGFSADASDYVGLTAADSSPAGYSSITGALHWTSGEVPDSSHDYLATNYTMRTPEKGAAAFAGRSLQIGLVGADTGKLLAKGPSVSYANEGLILAKGSYALGADKLEHTIAGKVTVLSPESAPFSLTSEYSTWSRFVVSAEMVSTAGTKMKIDGTKDSLANYEVRITGDVSRYNGIITVAHAETTLSLAGQTMPGAVSVDAVGAALALQSATDLLTVGSLAFTSAGSVLRLPVDEANGTNAIIRVTSAFSAVSGVKVDLSGATFSRSRYPLIEFAAGVVGTVDPSMFTCTNTSDDSVRFGFAVENLAGGGRLFYAYPKVDVLDSVDGATLGLSRSVADGQTLAVVLEGLDGLFTNSVLRLDASDASTVSYSNDVGRGENVVTAWRDTLGRTTLEPYKLGRASDPKVKAFPTYQTVAIGGGTKGVLDFGERSSFSSISEGCTGSAIPIAATTAIEFYSVVADTNCTDDAARNVLGFGYSGNMKDYTGGADNKYPFRRYGKAILAYHKTDSCKSLVDGGIYVDGSSATAEYEPELGAFHVYAFYATGSLTFNSIAAGYNDAVGGEMVGELVAFAAANSPARQGAIRSYLQRKWLGSDTLIAVPVDSIAVSGTGTLALDCGEYCSLVPSALSFDVSSSTVYGKLSVNGRVAIPASGTVAINVANGGKLMAGDYELVSATSIVGAENIESWALDVGERNAEKSIRLLVSDGKVVMRVHASGLVLTFR